MGRDVQCDGTNTLSFIEREGGRRPGCWAHARRRFVEAARSRDKVALQVLKRIAPLFRVEKESTAAGDDAEARKRRRQRESRPVIDELRRFVDKKAGATPPKTPLGRAFGYLLRQWRRLILFLDDGNVELTNNRRERELRRLVLGRKNWLFTWGDIGGERTATILTVIATCIAHDIDPHAYLHTVAKRLLQRPSAKKRRHLLPDRILELHPELAVGDDDEDEAPRRSR